jgi:hypothetical protein
MEGGRKKENEETKEGTKEGRVEGRKHYAQTNGSSYFSSKTLPQACNMNGRKEGGIFERKNIHFKLEGLNFKMP